MQRFTLIHDGSDQGWQTAYLALHIAARLGAVLLALIIDTTSDWKKLAYRATQVEVGGRAAQVPVGTRVVADFSLDVLTENAAGSNGLFVPRRFVPDGETATRFLEALSCPLWIVSQNAEAREMAVLVDDFAANESLIHYTATLAHRIQEPLTGLVHEDKIARIPKTGNLITWVPLAKFSHAEITAATRERNASLLFLPASNASLLGDLPMNCVVFPVL